MMNQRQLTEPLCQGSLNRMEMRIFPSPLLGYSSATGWLFQLPSVMAEDEIISKLAFTRFRILINSEWALNDLHQDFKSLPNVKKCMYFMFYYVFAQYTQIHNIHSMLHYKLSFVYIWVHFHVSESSHRNSSQICWRLKVMRGDSAKGWEGQRKTHADTEHANSEQKSSCLESFPGLFCCETTMLTTASPCKLTAVPDVNIASDVKQCDRSICHRDGWGSYSPVSAERPLALVQITVNCGEINQVKLSKIGEDKAQ